MSALRVLAFLALIGVCSSQTSDCSYWGLLNHLNLTTTNNARKMMRPVKNWTTPTRVKLDMVLFGIMEVNEKSQTLTSHAWYEMKWQNEFLTWNSSDFCGIEVVTIPRSSLWVPDLTIQEDASDSGSIQNSALLTVISSGAVFSSGRQRLTSTCRMNLFLFPMDIQSCTITFASMSYTGDVVRLEAANSDEILTMISEKVMVTLGEWQLESITVFNQSTQPTPPQTLKYVVTIIRKPMLYVINFIIPLFFFLVLDLASFFINETRGEKLGFKVTILLSISVLLLILKDMLPSTEDNLPMIARFCVTVFTMVGLSLLEAMLVSFLLDLDDYCGKKPQRSNNTQVEIQLEANHQVNTDAAEAEEEKGPGNPVPLEQLSDHDLLKQILEEVKAAHLEAGGQDKDQKQSGRYTRVAEIIDTVFFSLYFLTVLVCMAYSYIVWCENCFHDDE